ncbi:putative redox protein [Hymenobacter luteus]|uniref:OsmC family peroxiredoxin n=3 Tax=Hymenobacter TaxID=89966 RepID=A0A3R9LY63_9BACT|nr:MULTISPECIES: OsmC family protein [Hymenobacter]MBB4603652.1 putative redox protein [Hymenobacter latericoloratus]MBB6061399.1 putative redox protein [Hymenobacter luteus]RSK25024.1 OsmC family peroxiredoxin [Hymenobacter metallilatus]
MTTLTGRLDAAPYRTAISLERGRTLLADEPADRGGQDLGPSPGELLAASLSACTCITLRMYADRNQWPLRDIEAVVTFERDERQVITRLDVVLRLQGELSDEQLQRLLRVAHQCPIHKTLMAAVPLSVQLAG